MFKCQKNKLWLEYIPNFFCSTSIIPLDGMTLAEQMNALSRLVLVVFLILSLFSIKNSVLFLVLALLFIIILYFIQKKQMETFRSEHYKPPQKQSYPSPSGPGGCGLKLSSTRGLVFDNPTSKFYCDDFESMDTLRTGAQASARPGSNKGGVYNNPNYVSLSQRLAGKQNPRTLIPPVIVPPAADLSYWAGNNLATFPQINSESNIDVYRSGYQVSTCCPGTYTDRVLVPNPSSSGCTKNQHLRRVKEDYDFPYLKSPIDDQQPTIRSNQPGQVNTTCGYNPNQVSRSGIPNNIAAGNCMTDPMLKQYNENLFTQTIQPGVYSYNQVNEPISANIGISFQQQFEPTTCSINPETGETLYTEHDPRTMELIEGNVDGMDESLQPGRVTEANVYDPRFTGYGTSYRSYTDENLGQTRFYYDDINAIRMPNYLTRSNIDHQPFADHYGPLQDPEGNRLTSNIHALANDSFMRSAVSFRTDLQERLTRKARANAWQQRVAPISTSGQRMLGGNGRIH